MNAKHLPARMYTPDAAEEILRRVALGEALGTVCKDPMLINRDTVWGWIRDDLNGFADGYARAKEMAMERMAEEVIEISDDGSNDYMDRNHPDNTGYDLRGEHVQRSKLRVDTRKWLMSKLAPKKYGDRVSVDHGVQEGIGERMSKASQRMRGEGMTIEATPLEVIEGGKS